MNDSDFKLLLKEGSLDKLEGLVGKDKDFTTRVVGYLRTSPPSPSFLGLCALLLLEKYGEMVEVIRNILRVYPEKTFPFISDLSESKYYYQRMAVPRILTGCENELFMRSDLLMRCFKDPSGVVIKEAVESLKDIKIKGDIKVDEIDLLEIAMALNSHQFDHVQCLVPDILVLLPEKSFLVQEVCHSKSWRKRLAIAKKISFFSPPDKETIFSLLHEDEEEGVRAALVEEYGEKFMKDPSERVRALAIRAIASRKKSKKDLLKEAVDDPSWLVRKELLCIHDEEIYESISLPLISSLPTNFDWRVKGEILESIHHISLRNVHRCLTDILFSYLSDKVSEIRTRASRVIQAIVETSEWARDWEGRIRDFTLSPNYLLRMAVVPVCHSYDGRFGTSFSHTLLKDKIPNVRLKALEEIKEVESEELRNVILEMPSDIYIEKEKKRLGL